MINVETKKNMSTDLITIKQFAELYNMKKSTVYNLIQNRSLPHYRFTERKIYFLKSEVEEYLTRNRVSSTSEAGVIECNLTENKKDVVKKPKAQPSKVVQTKHQDKVEPNKEMLFGAISTMTNDEKFELICMLNPTADKASLLIKLNELYPVYAMPNVKKGDMIFHPIAGKKEVVEADEKWIYFYGNGSKWKCDRNGYIDGLTDKPRSVWESFESYAKDMNK